jgi:hypothetical protein
MHTSIFSTIEPCVISDRASYRTRAIASRNRKFPIIGQIKDVHGAVWDIREVRITKHGFDLHFGNPSDAHGSYYGGLPRLIDTQALHDFWDRNRLKGHGFLFDLPAGRTTLKRARRRMGFNFDHDYEQYWVSLLPDLAALRPRDFAAKHGVKPELAFDRRAKMLGRRARPLGWWRTPETIALLLSGRTHKAVGLELGIGTSQVHRLRVRVKAEQG